MTETSQFKKRCPASFCESPVMHNVKVQSTSSLPLLPDPLSFGVVVADWVPSMDQKISIKIIRVRLVVNYLG